MVGTPFIQLSLEGPRRWVHSRWRFTYLRRLGNSIGVRADHASCYGCSFCRNYNGCGTKINPLHNQEWGSIYQISPLKNNYISTLVAVAACLLLAFGVSNGNYPGDGGTLIWPVFGATNQILASMTLIVLAVYLLKLGRSAKPLIIPMCFILFMASWAGVWYVTDYISRGQWILVIIQVAVMVSALFIILESLSTISKLRKGEDSQDEQVSVTSGKD